MDTPDHDAFAPTQKREALGPESTDEAGAWERTVMRDILVGARIGDYVVQHRIGSGGMGMVYAAEDPRIGRRVAIKVLRPDRSDARGLLEEARNSNVVRHRGLVDVYGYGELPGIGQYLVMEYLEGKPLDLVLHDRGSLPVTEVLSILDELVAALDAAHSKGVIHRDLKPSNIFLISEAGGASYVKILDFGLAKKSAAPGETANQTRVSVVVGTPHYMAPEQAMGKPVGPKTDLYAVGVIAYELLVGNLPFTGEAPMEIAIKQVNDAPPVPAQQAQMPDELSDLILALLSKDPKQRPTGLEVRQALRRIQLSPPGAELHSITGPVPQLHASAAMRAQAPGAKKAPTTVEETAVKPRRSFGLLLGGLAVAGAAALAVAAWMHLKAAASEPASLPSPVAVAQPTIIKPLVEPEQAEGAPAPSSAPDAPAPSVATASAAPAPEAEAEPEAEVEGKAKAPAPAVKTVTAPPEPRRTRKRAPAVSREPAKLTVKLVGGVAAEVFVAGKSLGYAPLKDRSIPAGNHTVSLRLANGHTEVLGITAPAGGRVLLLKRWDPEIKALTNL